MPETMTIEQAMEVTMKMLSEIEIPISMTEKVGEPVFKAIHNMQMMLDALHQAHSMGNGAPAGETAASAEYPNARDNGSTVGSPNTPEHSSSPENQDTDPNEDLLFED